VDVQNPPNYSRTQIILHWTVAVLVIMQFLLHDGVEHVWDAYEDGIAPPQGDIPLAYLHVATGATILILALWRLYLRLTRGAPPLPEQHHPLLKAVARITHYLLYALIIGLPVLGASAWFLGIEAAAELHAALTPVLFWTALVHIAGGLAEHFIFRTNVLKRMLGIEPKPASN